MVTRANEGQLTATLPGTHNELELYTDRVIVRRKDVFSKLFQGDRTLYVREIAAVRLYECRFAEHGQLRLELVDHTQEPIVLDYPCKYHQMAETIRASIEAILHKA